MDVEVFIYYGFWAEEDGQDCAGDLGDGAVREGGCGGGGVEGCAVGGEGDSVEGVLEALLFLCVSFLSRCAEKGRWGVGRSEKTNPFKKRPRSNPRPTHPLPLILPQIINHLLLHSPRTSPRLGYLRIQSVGPEFKQDEALNSEFESEVYE